MGVPTVGENPQAPGVWRQLQKAPLLILVVLALDQLTKLLVRECLSLGESIPDGSRLRLTYVVNPGMVFGIGASSTLTLLLPLTIILVVAAVYWRYRRSNSTLLDVGSGLFIGGTMGNLVDRVIQGHVTDFIEVVSHGGNVRTIFNLADLSIIVGIFILEAFLVSHIIGLIRQKGMHYNPVKAALARRIRREDNQDRS